MVYIFRVALKKITLAIINTAIHICFYPYNFLFYNVNMMSHTTVSKTGKPIFPTCLLQHNLVHFKVNSEINRQKTFHCNGLWCIVYNITLNTFLHDLLFSNPGSPSRHAPLYLMVSVDILLDRPNTFPTPFLLVLTLKSVESPPCDVSYPGWPQKFFGFTSWIRQFILFSVVVSFNNEYSFRSNKFSFKC